MFFQAQCNLTESPFAHVAVILAIFTSVMITQRESCSTSSFCCAGGNAAEQAFNYKADSVWANSKNMADGSWLG